MNPQFSLGVPGLLMEIEGINRVIGKTFLILIGLMELIFMVDGKHKHTDVR